jgi:hypothetical protein
MVVVVVKELVMLPMMVRRAAGIGIGFHGRKSLGKGLGEVLGRLSFLMVVVVAAAPCCWSGYGEREASELVWQTGLVGCCRGFEKEEDRIRSGLLRCQSQ